jgi:hypothetical protein
MTKQDTRLKKVLAKFGVRRPPVLSFLDRTHFVNRRLGKLRYGFLKSLGKEV